jgi:hypothetical protein
MDLRVTGGNRRGLMEKEPPGERKRRRGPYRIIAELLIGFICALAATGIYILAEKFM